MDPSFLGGLAFLIHRNTKYQEEQRRRLLSIEAAVRSQTAVVAQRDRERQRADAMAEQREWEQRRAEQEAFERGRAEQEAFERGRAEE